MILLLIQLVRAFQAKDWPTVLSVLAQILTKLAGGLGSAGAGLSAQDSAELATAEAHLKNAAAQHNITVP